MSSSSPVINFQCTACHSPLTVPAHMAGVTGPCPKCGAVITSPQASPSGGFKAGPATIPVPAMPVGPVSQPVQTAPQQAYPQQPAHAPQQGYPAAQQPAFPNQAPLPQQAAPASGQSLWPGAPPAVGQPPAYQPHQQIAASAASPSPHPALDVRNAPPPGGSTIMGGNWPPNAKAHPILDSLLQSNVSLAGNSQPDPLPAAQAPVAAPHAPLPQVGAATVGSTPIPSRTAATTPQAPSQNRAGGTQSAAPARRSTPPPPADKRRGVFMMGTILMALLTLAAASWFFQDQIKAAWRTHNMSNSHDQDSASVDISSRSSKPTEPATSTTPPVKAPTPDTTAKASEPSPPGFDPDAAPRKALPANPSEMTPPPNLGSNSPLTPPNPLNQPSPPVNVPKPTPDKPVTPPNLVEVPPPVIPKAVPVPEAPKELTIKATPDSKPAVDVLKKFFAAENWKERLKYVQLPDQLQPNMEEYYASNPDGPIAIDHIELLRQDKNPQQGVPHCVFEVSGPGLESALPIMVEESKDGFRVDWLTFTEFKDKLLLKFGQTFTDRPARFHVMIRRTHYFDDDVPQMDKKQCFELQPPVPGFTVNVFASKGTTLAQELDRYVGWEVANAAAIVELQWRKQDNYQWIELVNVPQYHWRNVVPGEQVAAKQPEKK